jgi:serine/threonine protein phosphatase PrpC
LASGIALTAAANAAGGKDNISVIAIRVDGAASADAPAALSPQQELADDEGAV